MAFVNILKFPVSFPADTSPFQKLKDAGYDAAQIIAVVGKCEGNGCVNDFSRTLSALAWEPLIPPDAITIFSGGTEGVLSPHVTLFVREPKRTGLLVSVARTRALVPHELGKTPHALQVAQTVEKMKQEARVSTEHVNLVLIKCPLLTSSKIDAIRAAGQEPITMDTYKSMAKSRYASALGISVALEELCEPFVEFALGKEERWTAKASCSSGAELEDCHILLLASDPSSGSLRAVSSVTKDALDACSIIDALGQVKQEGGEMVQVFVKAEADPSGTIRGSRHTMCTDSDIQSTRHARPAVGGLVAGLTGDTLVYDAVERESKSGRGEKNFSLVDGLMIPAVLTILGKGSTVLMEQARWNAAVI